MKVQGKEVKLIDLERDLLPTSLHTFIQKAWHVTQSDPYQDNWHIACISEHLEDVTAGRIKNLVINIPPACMKTLTASMYWPVWEWLTKPASGFIAASYDATLTLRTSRETIRLIRSPWFQQRWPLKLRGDAGTEYLNTEGGFRFNTSIQGKITGRHCTRAIIDDPLKPQTVSKITLDGCERWWRESLQTRFKNPQDRSICIIMQRLHERDLSAIAVAEGYEHLKLPMRWEPAAYSIPDRDNGWALDAGVTYSKDGDLLWPKRFSKDRLDDMERTMGSQATAAQHQQRPVPAGGLIFRQEWFQHWDQLPPRFDKMCQSWDCAFKGTEDSDYVVGQVWGKYKADFYLLDQYRARANVMETMRAIRAMTVKWPRATAKYVEDKANGPAVIDMLKKSISGMIAVSPEGGKESRANAVSPLFEALNVWLPPMDRAPWVKEFKDELLAFPLGVHDDQVDACSQGLNQLHQRKSIHAAMENVRKEGLEGWFGSGMGGGSTPW